MRFFAFEEDLKGFSQVRGFALGDFTSVEQQKRHFFETIRSFGELSFLRRSSSYKELVSLFKKPDVIFVRFHGAQPPLLWEKIPKRLLAHSLGDFLLPNLIPVVVDFPFNKMYLVATDFQRARLERHLGSAAPKMAVFTPRLDEANFYLPAKKERMTARRRLGILEKDAHIVYAGRWLANKGICQLMRALNLWPLKNVKITLVGAFNPGFGIRQSSTSHLTFENYFRREFLCGPLAKQTRLLKTRDSDGLREVLHSADLFVYPSVHEDENFGMAPREAALCGTPVVITDFCGLHPLAASMPWGGIVTYPAFNGPRYSLRQFRNLISRSLNAKEACGQDYSVSVKKECNPEISRSNLQKAIKLLLKTPLRELPNANNIEKEGMLRLFRHADKRILQAFIEKKKKMPDGGLVDGTGEYDKGFPYIKLFQTIQGFYTTMDEIPIVKAGDTLRGFFRIAVWKEEKAVVEFGFPGPRIKRFSDKDWLCFVPSVKFEKTSEITICPIKEDQIRLAQELVDSGYIVPDYY